MFAELGLGVRGDGSDRHGLRQNSSVLSDFAQRGRAFERDRLRDLRDQERAFVLRIGPVQVGDRTWRTGDEEFFAAWRSDPKGAVFAPQGHSRIVGVDRVSQLKVTAHRCFPSEGDVPLIQVGEGSGEADSLVEAPQ